MKGYSDKLVLITGGSSGIGLATAKLFAQRGAHVAILARDKARLAAAATAIEAARQSATQKVTALSADVSDLASLTPAAEELTQTMGVPHVLINAAGVARPGLLTEMDAELYRWMMDINFHGTVNATKAFLPGMIARQSGHIVNISSAAGFLGMYGYTAYGATKFAVKGFSDALRQELRPHNIQLSIVFPPDTETPQLIEDNRYKPPVLVAVEEGSQIMTADQVARSILKGIDRKRYIITPGWMSTLYFLAAGLTGGGLIYPIMDFALADAHNKVRRNPDKYKNQDVVNPD